MSVGWVRGGTFWAVVPDYWHLPASCFLAFLTLTSLLCAFPTVPPAAPLRWALLTALSRFCYIQVPQTHSPHCPVRSTSRCSQGSGSLGGHHSADSCLQVMISRAHVFGLDIYQFFANISLLTKENFLGRGGVEDSTYELWSAKFLSSASLLWLNCV